MNQKSRVQSQESRAKSRTDARLSTLDCRPLLRSALCVALVAGCRGERQLTEDDCTALRARIEGAWNRDAVAAQHLVGTEAHTRFIGDEQRHIGEAWRARCTALVGQRVADREIRCLEKADTIDDVQECAR